MPRTVSGSTGALHRFFTVIGGVAAKRALVNGAIRISVEWHTKMLEFVHHLVGFAAHELNGILIAQPVRAFDGVVEVIVPVVFRHVAQAGTNATLCSHCV